MSKFAILCIVAVSLVLPIPVFARELTSEERRATEEIGRHMVETMQMLLLEYYSDEPLTPGQLYEATMRGIASALDDYTEFMTEEELEEFIRGLSGEFYGIGVRVSLNGYSEPEIMHVFTGSPAENAGILIGDIITNINDTSVSGFALSEVISLIADSPTLEVTMEVQRNGTSRIFELTKAVFDTPTVRVEELSRRLPDMDVADNVGFVALDMFGGTTATEFGDVLNNFQDSGINRIILDLRGNPGGMESAVVQIGNMLVPSGILYSTLDAAGNTQVALSRLRTQPFERVVVLTDRHTASAAELLASALQDSGAGIVVGESTYGKGVIQQTQLLPGGGALKFTIKEYFSRNGNAINNIGVMPDVEIELPDFIVGPIRLDRHNSNPSIISLKTILDHLGYDIGEPNAYLDNITRESLRTFQQNQGLAADGNPTYETVSALSLALSHHIRGVDPILRKGFTKLVE